ncbi:MAG: dephospho-CoA kinase [Candidatus Omnitrophota bacterium]
MLKPNKVKFVLGITGNIACGKSTVANMFKTKDCLLLDADVLTHKLLASDKLVCSKIVKNFSPSILKRDNIIDRKKLGKIVFTDPSALVKLNSIVHPLLIKEIKGRIKDSDKRIIILDAALIVEAGLTKMIDKLIVVKVKNKAQQVLRASRSGGFSKQDMVLRIKSQISQNKKLSFADFIIDNSGQVSETRKQVFAIRRTLACYAGKDFTGQNQGGPLPATPARI